MSIFITDRAEAYRDKSFLCRHCGRDFKARVTTWVDVTRIPQVRQALLNQEFNVIPCTHCGSLHFAEVPFFYEDFEEGMLVAVFPQAPENSDALEAEIRKKFGHYPIVECFYDMAQIWLLIYLQNFFRSGSTPHHLVMAGKGEKQAVKLLRFLKKDPLMAAIKEKLDDIFSGDSEDGENLIAVLGQAVYRLEGLHPWPLDRRCICRADISPMFKCCGRRLDFNGHELLLSQHRSIRCPTCGKAFTHAACSKCGRTYAWDLGIVDSFEGGDDFEHLFPRVHCSFPLSAGSGM